jgi:acyl-CoA synthetase (AMP-forming)/AMP-acid ligase II
MDVTSVLRRSVRHFAWRPAVIDGERTLDYATLGERVERLANALLGLGLKPGDRVVDLQHNAHTYIETDLALAMAGLVRVAVNPRLTPADWAFITADSGARALVYGRGFAGPAEELLAKVDGIDVVIGAERGPGMDYEEVLGRASPAPVFRRPADPGDLVSLNYSSGTTGRPKGCMRTVGNRVASLRDMLVDLFEGGLGPSDVWLHAGPLTHASGLFVLPHVAVGACQVVLPHFDPAAVLDLMERRRVTGTVLVPTMVERLLAEGVAARGGAVTRGRLAGRGGPAGRATLAGRDLSSLTRVAYAGAPMAPDRIQAANQALGNTMVQFYGMVEAIPPLTVLRQADHARLEPLGSAGRAVLGAELELVDEAGHRVPDGVEGELVVRGDHVMAGYWGLEDATGKALRDGALWTGDMARQTEDGYVTIIDRRHDMIITGGYNVFPREVEEVLAADPALTEVAVIGLPDPDWGQAVTALVVAQPGAEVDVERLRDRCRERLAAFKRPKRIEVVDALPKTPAGKIDKKALRNGGAPGNPNRRSGPGDPEEVPRWEVPR